MDRLLKLYDTELLRFSLTECGREEPAVSVLAVNDACRFLLPPDLEPTDAGLARWLRNRLIPRNRDFAEELLAALGLDFCDVGGILDVSLGLSLNDCFWIVPEGFPGSFAQYDLYDNPFFAGTGRTTCRRKGLPRSNAICSIASGSCCG